ISAVLIEEGFPYIDGYKPRVNYQDRLRVEVVARLVADAPLAAAAAAVVSAEVGQVSIDRSLDAIWVPVPAAGPRGNRALERAVPAAVPRLGVNYLEREASNASLGSAGERFVLEFEHRRLWEAGARHLADRIEHVARTRGDGLGFDIASFDSDGSERLIEVKTTSFGPLTPFFASNREVVVSDERSDQFCLYRVFRFRTAPQLFIIAGSLRRGCLLEPVQFRATLP
ncbi:MAG: DUF3883 domain-containing protein, partial [Gemmatimonadaceae bacterium]|nr:DUF3883 domain-containing protein [Gemmatimonadaceae bacterium]